MKVERRQRLRTSQRSVTKFKTRTQGSYPVPAYEVVADYCAWRSLWECALSPVVRKRSDPSSRRSQEGEKEANEYVAVLMTLVCDSGDVHWMGRLAEPATPHGRRRKGMRRFRLVSHDSPLFLPLLFPPVTPAR